jgi:glycine hydroxymethyltransferase
MPYSEELLEIYLREKKRQDEHIELIASENFVSDAIRELSGSIFTNKYAEGRPKKRYYNGCAHMDEMELLAERYAKELFGINYVNVQPHSGANANLAAFFGLLEPRDTILGMSLDHGGHLSHGSPVNISGKWFSPVSYGTDSNGFIDYDELKKLATAHEPKLIIAGASAYPRQIDWAKFRAVADEVGAYLLADVSHYAGLIAGGVYDSPVGYADVITTTTHKTLRGPRGGIIMTDSSEIATKINKAVFPGTQGGPLMHIIAAKAQCFYEASQSNFKDYAKKVVQNAQAMSKVFTENGIDVVTGGTDSHIVLLDLREFGMSGKELANHLEKSKITVNANSVPNDPLPPNKGSGIRIGTAAMTTKGYGVNEFKDVADQIIVAIKEDL